MSTIVIEFDPADEEKIVEQDGQPAAVVMTFERYQTLRNGSSVPSTNGEDLRRRSTAFKQGIELEELARQQGVGPIRDPNLLKGNFWPENESIDEFIATIRQWRDESIRTDVRGANE